MHRRAVAACLFVLFAPLAPAGERPQSAPAPASAATADRAKLDALRGQEKHEDAQVQQLKKRVDTLESGSQATSRDIQERDRKIAELRRQLEASQGK
jgi:septal ring factor EnvC (AmiA/AmiB activator)